MCLTRLDSSSNYRRVMDRAASPRIEPLPATGAPEFAALFESFTRTLGFIPNSALTMQRKPKLLQAFVAMSDAVWGQDSAVDLGLKRLIAHAASRVAGCAYCMAHTASGAVHLGIDPAKLSAIDDRRTSPLFTAAECAALDLAVAASAIPNRATDEMFAELHLYWSETQIVEIVAAISWIGFVARWNSTMATPLEDKPAAIGEKYLAAGGWTPGRHRA